MGNQVYENDCGREIYHIYPVAKGKPMRKYEFGLRDIIEGFTTILLAMHPINIWNYNWRMTMILKQN